MEPRSLQVVSQTDVGLVKRRNEDAVSITLEEGLMILADGVGGNKAGDIASRLAVDVMSETMRAQLSAIPIQHRYSGHSKTNALEMLKVSLDFTNNIVYTTAKQFKQCAGMCTTLVTCLFFKDYVAISNIGDSRVYRSRDSLVTQLTQDHCFVKDGHKHLTKAVGSLETVVAEITTFIIENNDLYLICSDGLSDMLSDAELTTLLIDTKLSLNDLCDLLISKAKAVGGLDNITVILVRVIDQSV